MVDMDLESWWLEGGRRRDSYHTVQCILKPARDVGMSRLGLGGYCSRKAPLCYAAIPFIMLNQSLLCPTKPARFSRLHACMVKKGAWCVVSRLHGAREVLFSTEKHY